MELGTNGFLVPKRHWMKHLDFLSFLLESRGRWFKTTRPTTSYPRQFDLHQQSNFRPLVPKARFLPTWIDCGPSPKGSLKMKLRRRLYSRLCWDLIFLRRGLPQYAERAIVAGWCSTAKFLQSSDQALGHLCRFIDGEAFGDGEKSISSEHFTVGIASLGDSVSVGDDQIIGQKAYSHLHIVRAIDEPQGQPLDDVSQGRCRFQPIPSFCSAVIPEGRGGSCGREDQFSRRLIISEENRAGVLTVRDLAV